MILSGLTAKIAGAAAVAAFTFAAVQTVRIEGFLWIDGFKQDVAKRDKTIAGLIAAAKEAEAKQAALTATYSAANRSLTERLDHAAALEAGAARDAAERFAALNRVRKDCVRPRPAASPAVPDPAPEHDGEAEFADVVAVPRADYDQLVAGALQGARAWRDAAALIDAGYAVKGETVWPEIEIGAPAP